MVGGANFSCTRDSSVPNRDLERQGAALRRKFDALMEPILDKRDRSEIVGAVDSLDSLGDVALLARFCSRTARSEQ
jgi:hypothetical protein